MISEGEHNLMSPERSTAPIEKPAPPVEEADASRPPYIQSKIAGLKEARKRPADEPATLEPGTLEHSVRLLLYWLMGIAFFLAGVNLTFIPLESPGSPNPAAKTIQPPAAPVHTFSETKRFIKHQLDLDREGNFATWFSSAQLALAGLAAMTLAALRRKRGWLWIGFGLFYVSLDELAQLHEWVGVMMWRSHLTLGFIVPPYPWVLIFAPPLLVFGVWMIGFVRRELADQPKLFKLAALAVVLMAISLPLEVLGGHFEATSGRMLRLESTFEETFEMLGESLLLYVMLRFVVRSLANSLSKPRET